MSNVLVLKRSTIPSLRVVRGCSCFVGSTQYTQFLHDLVLEFSSLIRMDNDWHAEPTRYLVEKRIGYRVCSLI